MPGLHIIIVIIIKHVCSWLYNSIANANVVHALLPLSGSPSRLTSLFLELQQYMNTTNTKSSAIADKPRDVSFTTYQSINQSIIYLHQAM